MKKVKNKTNIFDLKRITLFFFVFAILFSGALLVSTILLDRQYVEIPDGDFILPESKELYFSVYFVAFIGTIVTHILVNVSSILAIIQKKKQLFLFVCSAFLSFCTFLLIVYLETPIFFSV